MAYNTVAIKKDVDGKPIPQYYNAITNQYEDLQGLQGASKTILYDENGNKVDVVALINSIITVLNQKNLPTGASTSAKQDDLKLIIDNIYNKDNTKTFYGLSTETKPISNNIKGNKYFEINTGNVFMWSGTTWVVI